MAKTRGDMLQGTLDLLVLKVLQLGPMHGWGITQLIKQHSDDVLQVNEGSLYPSLYRLKRQRLIASAWHITENNRRARYYSLTPVGRQRLSEERAVWERLSGAVNRVLEVPA